MSWDKKDRRQFVRASFPCDLSFQTTGENIVHTQTENISAGGIRVFTERKLPPASIVNVTIYKIKEEPLICKGRIIWVFQRKHPSNNELILFDTGIEFYHINKEIVRQIQDVIESLTHSMR